MKVELYTLMTGDLKLEVIAETDLEYRVLQKAWELNGYERGKGKTVTPDGMAAGFFIPLCRLSAPAKRREATTTPEAAE